MPRDVRTTSFQRPCNVVLTSRASWVCFMLLYIRPFLHAVFLFLDVSSLFALFVQTKLCIFKFKYIYLNCFFFRILIILITRYIFGCLDFESEVQQTTLEECNREISNNYFFLLSSTSCFLFL